MFRLLSLVLYATMSMQLYSLSNHFFLLKKVNQSAAELERKMRVIEKENQLLEEQLKEVQEAPERVQQELVYFRYRAVPTDEGE